jgi:hypothetical protein
VSRLCLSLGWSSLHEVRLDNGRRADVLALRPDGGFVCIEIKSDINDFRADRKWHHYRDYADALYFAVDTDFPQAVLPEDCGLIVVWEAADLLRPAPEHRMSAPRRRALTQRFAHLAALRLQALEDPAGMIEMQSALRVE